jgi:hypothetical protein
MAKHSRRGSNGRFVAAPRDEPPRRWDAIDFVLVASFVFTLVAYILQKKGVLH